MKKKEKEGIIQKLSEKEKKGRLYNCRVELLGVGNDTCVNELVPGVGQAGQTPVDAIGVGSGVGLLVGGQHFALADGVDGGVGVLPVLGEGGDVDEMDWHFHGLRYVHSDVEQPTVGAHFQRRRHV